MTYYALLIGSILANALPLPFAYRVADLLGQLTFMLSRGKRANMLANMQVVLGKDRIDAAVHALAAASMRNYCRYLVDFLRFHRVARDKITDVVRFDSWQKLQEATATGRGVIFAGVHMGNWDLAGLALSANGYPLNAIAETFKDARIDRLVHRTRTRLGMRIWPMEGSLLRVFRLLRKGEAVAILVDRPDKDGIPVEFFGREAWVPGGAATLALRTGAQILPGAIISHGDGTYSGLLSEPIDYTPTGSYEADIRYLTQRVMSAVEAMIRQKPDQWFMFRRMWPDASDRDGSLEAGRALTAT